ncbi:MAG: metallophosphoesterase [Acidimicrobiales bacterium]
MARPALRRVGVAAIEDTTVQVGFHAPAGLLEVRFRTDRCDTARHDADRYGHGGRVRIEHPGGPGLVDLSGLPPATVVHIEVVAGRARRTCAARTLPAPPGAELVRVATVSDLHVGSTTHGLADTMFDRSPYREPAPVRCARGALREATAWGAALLVGKGDLTQHGWAEEWQALGDVFEQAAPHLPRLGVPGNHDRPAVRDIAPQHGLLRAGFSEDLLEWSDLPGIRVIAADSAGDSQGHGSLAAHGDAVVDLAADAARDGRAVLLCLHHPIERAPLPLQYPKGVAWGEGRALARRLAAANRSTLITAGHTHRNRRRRVAGLVHTEVGSTKDWPGVWGGYAVHEGGIRQVVRRITAADAIGWIDYTRWAAGGLWWPYAPGRLADRCFTHSWPSCRRG